MLVLTRKLGEAVQIGPDITVRVTRLEAGSVRLAIEAPPSVRVFRDEIYQQMVQDNQSAFLATAQEIEATVRRFRQVRSLVEGHPVPSGTVQSTEISPIGEKNLLPGVCLAKEPHGGVRGDLDPAVSNRCGSVGKE